MQLATYSIDPAIHATAVFTSDEERDSCLEFVSRILREATDMTNCYGSVLPCKAESHEALVRVAYRLWNIAGVKPFVRRNHSGIRQG